MLKLYDWSYSRYSLWKVCPAKLRFQMEDTRPRALHPAASRGVEIHKSVENYLLGATELRPELDYYKTFLAGLRDLGAKPEVRLAVDKFWEPTEWDSPDRWWRGVLDCAVRVGDEDKITIYDWKTGQEYPDHRSQREIYAAGYHSCYPYATIDVMHVYVDKKQNTITTFTAEDVPDLKNIWSIRVEEMLNDETFAPNPGFYCRTCPYSRAVGGPCPF